MEIKRYRGWCLNMLVRMMVIGISRMVCQFVHMMARMLT